MSEQPKTPKINISIDHTENEKQLQKQLDEAHIKIGALLNEHKEKNDNDNERKTIESKTIMNPPTTGDSASLDNEPSHKAIHGKQVSEPIELDPECEIPMFAKADSVEEVISFLVKNHELGNKSATKILDIMTKRALKQGGTFEFQGSISPTKMVNNKLVKVERVKNNLNNMKYSGSFKNIEDE